jgi:hypothetical protein
VTPVWANFWLAKDHSKACWASWLRELASLGLEPVELKTGMLGIAVGLSESLAKSLVTLRLRQMNEVVMRNAVIAPPWSLRNILAYKDCHSPLPVGCLCPEGTFHFSSEGEAHKITGVPSLSVLVARVDFDKHGCLWFED